MCRRMAIVRQAPAQQRPHRKQEAQQHNERNGRKRCAYPHLTVTCGPFSRPICCDSSSGDRRLVVPGAEFPGVLPKSKQSGAYSAGLLPAGPKTNPAPQGIISRPLRRAERRIGQRRQQALHRCKVVDDRFVKTVLCSLRSGQQGYLEILTW